MTSTSAAGSLVNMVDCSNTRCIQERRLFKKELLTWSKKVPLIVGIELVAEELLGKEVVNHLLEPLSSLETDEVTDWEPAASCCFCQTRKKGDQDAFRQSMEQDCGPTDVRSGAGPHSPTSDTPALRYLQQLLPFAHYPPGLLPDLPSSCSAQDDGKPLDLSATSQNNRATNGSDDRDSAASPKPSVELKVPQIMKSGKKKDLNGKKAYTEEELAAAVNDIRSGKLGTRRAAVLYGIPRSTLRNKIFKLESEQNGGTTENGAAAPHHDNKLSMVDLLQGMPNGDYPGGSGSLGGLGGFMGFGDDSMLSSKLLFPGEELWEQKLEQIRRKHNLLEPDRKFGMPPMHFASSHHLSDFEKSYFGSPFGSDLRLAFLPELVRRMAEERMEMERQQSLQSLQLDLRVSPRVMHGISGLGALNGANHHHHHSSSTSNSNHNNSHNNHSSSAGVELKVPSYKPMRTTFMNGFLGAGHHHHHHGDGDEDGERTSTPSNKNNANNNTANNNNNNSLTPKIGDTLKDIIAKTIAEKMRSRAMMSNSMHQLNINSNLPGAHSNPGPLSSDSSSISSNDMGPVEKRPRLSPNSHPHHHHRGSAEDKKNSSSDGNNSSGENKGSKKTRPKRGQYRKYNSQLLLEAVRAVQRGEMSVHRAGSYFGVPHSTLEYKVKERHLLRHKKPREGRSGSGNKTKEGGLSAPSSLSLLSTSNGSTSTTNTTSSTTAGTINTASCSPNSQSSSRSQTPVSLSPPLPMMNSAMSVISSLAHQAGHPGGVGNPLRLSSSALSPLGALAGWSSPPPSSNNTSSSANLSQLLPADPSMAGGYPAGFALNTSASELLKKLQRKVQAKASLNDSQNTNEMAAALRAAAAAAAAAATSTSNQGSSGEAVQVIAQ